ncbi:hypothetical protein L9F63_020300 [Diploptera punctata]|uniref:Uncharacterized protein n=1 Tax=Diploptera punctata TaxID=6984 RepID=A0AAD7ZSG3_DIPPU|nr:hypothetical protein L9F63_020300 [Diploptera punctata]
MEENNREEATNIQTEKTPGTNMPQEHPQNDQQETIKTNEEVDSNEYEENEFHEEPQNEEEYQIVKARKRGPRQRPTVMIGTGARESTLQIGEKIIWRYIGKLSHETSEDKVLSFLHKKCIKR